jgi:hypothetical protein
VNGKVETLAQQARREMAAKIAETNEAVAHAPPGACVATLWYAGARRGVRQDAALHPTLGGSTADRLWICGTQAATSYLLSRVSGPVPAQMEAP